jgi:tRNA isopentenyl-2-thiomethyl-A-37 hydroxylase MiaE
MNSEVQKTEIFLINRYAAYELAGAILLGKQARKVSNQYLMNNLTWHCMEEAQHSIMWQELIKKLNLPFIEIHDQKGEDYFSYIKGKENLIDFLAFTHIFEMRVPFHFTMHKIWTKNNEIKKMLEKLIREEDSHLKWIKEYLEKELKMGNTEVRIALDKFLELEKEIYLKDINKLENMGEDSREFVKIIKSRIGEFDNAPKWWK